MYRVIQRVIFVLLLISCSEDEVVRKYPLISTLEVANITEDGATFQGNITSTGKQPIVKYGFAWSETESPTLNNDENVILLATEGNDFEFHVKTTLKEQVTYYVRAFVQTEGFTVYGKNTSFISLGSGGPEIEGITPSKVTYADTIYINGKSFGKLATSNKVFLGEAQAEVAFSSDTLLKAIIPFTIADSSLFVSVSTVGNKTIHPTAIKVKTPQITEFSKSESVIGDTISINGHFFGPSPDLNTILFNEVKTTVLETASNSITVIVPIVDSPISVSITNSVGQTGKSDDFELLQAAINTITPEEGFWGDVVEIRGRNFGYIKEAAEVYFNGQKAIIDEFSNEQIFAEVPDGVSNPIEVKVRVSNQESNKKGFSFIELEINSINPTQGTWGNIITLAGSNLSSNSLTSIVRVDDFEAEIISQDQNAISFKIPQGVSSKNASIKIIRNDKREKDAPSPFIMNDPQISSLSAVSVGFSETLTIEGINFHPSANRNIVNFENTRLEVVSASPNSLVVKFPLSLIKDQQISESFEGVITVTTDIGMATSEIIKVNYSGAWTELERPDSISDAHSGMVSIAGDGGIYLFGGKKGINGVSSYSNKVQFYDTNSKEWNFISNFPGEGRIDANFFKNDHSIYIGSGKTSVRQVDLWKFDLSTMLWTQLQDVPYTSFQNGSSLIRDGNVFSILNGGLKSRDEICKYVILDDSWSIVNLDLPYQYYQLLGLFQSSDNFSSPVVEINNLNISQSTLHNVEFDAQLTNYAIIDSYNPFGVAQYDYIKKDQSLSVLVTSKSKISLINGGDKSDITLPLNQVTVEFLEIIAGTIYTGFSNGSFWSYNPSK